MGKFVDRATADKWSGVFCEELEIWSPSVADVERVIKALDAETSTLVSLYGCDGTYLSIGGGAGQYVVYASMKEDELWNLIAKDNANRENVILLNAGGQQGDFPARQVVDQQTALKAANTFLLTGKLDHDLFWEKQE